MSKTNSKKLITVAIIAVGLLTISLYAVLFTNKNAQAATDDNLMMSDTNEGIDISFSYDGVDSSTIPIISVLENNVAIPYDFGDKINFVSRVSVKVTQKDGVTSLTLTERKAQMRYSISLITPIGYSLVGTTPDITQMHTIEESTDICCHFEPYTGSYKVSGTIFKNIEESQEPLPGANVSLYNNDFNLVDETTTLEDGTFVFNNISKENANCYMIAKKEGRVDCWSAVDSSSYNQNTKTAKRQFDLRSIDEANFSLSSSNSNHKYFYTEVCQYYATTPESFTRHEIIRIDNINLFMHEQYAGSWIVHEDGSMVLETEIDSETHVFQKVKITPEAVEGYQFDYWAIDKTANEKIIVGPNGTFELRSGDKVIFDVAYKATYVPPQPGPTPPDPTPTEEEIAGSAQTGDSAAVIPLAILAVASATLLITRKRWLSK